MTNQSILNDWQIYDLCTPTTLNNPGKPMLDPFVPSSEKFGTLSYGLSYFGYDIRLGNTVQQLKPQTVDLSNTSPKCRISDVQYREYKLPSAGERHSDTFILKPGGFVIAGTLEKFSMPKDVCGLVKDKSTLARLGLAVQNTILEPGWEGYLTIEISNHGPLDIILYAEQPIAQVLFFRGSTPSKSYNGKYQQQKFGQGAI